MKALIAVILIFLAGCAQEIIQQAEPHDAHQGVPRADPAHYSAVLASPTSELGKPLTLSVEIRRKDGNILHFQQLHERLLHVMLIRDDLQHFAHTHPEDSGTVDTENGIFTFEHAFIAPGKYRVMLEFLDHDKQVTIPLDLAVPGTSEPVLLEQPSRTSETDGYAVVLGGDQKLIAGKKTSLSFDITRGGIPVTISEPFLGEPMHLAVWGEGLSYFEHAHPELHESTFDFHVTFPHQGAYKLFAQFKHEGKVITAPFVVRTE